MALHGFLTQHVGTDSMDQKPAAAPEEDTFEKRLAKPADWAALDDDTLAADLDAAMVIDIPKRSQMAGSNTARPQWS